jgi:hypothetical protein
MTCPRRRMPRLIGGRRGFDAHERSGSARPAEIVGCSWSVARRRSRATAAARAAGGRSRRVAGERWLTVRRSSVDQRPGPVIRAESGVPDQPATTASSPTSPPRPRRRSARRTGPSPRSTGGSPAAPAGTEPPAASRHRTRRNRPRSRHRRTRRQQPPRWPGGR